METGLRPPHSSFLREKDMTDITAAMVKELRESTGAGMLDCKKALVETSGNMDEAVDWLRKKGLASAAKKASRIAAEGLVSVYVEGNKGAVSKSIPKPTLSLRMKFFRNMLPMPLLLR